MRLNNRKLTWASAVTFSALLVGCTLENVPVGENDAEDSSGSGGKNSVKEIPADSDDGTGAGTSTDVDPVEPDNGTGASGGAGAEPVGGAGGEDPDRVNPLVTNYCEMEAACIPSCLVEEGVAPCDDPERRRECLAIELPMRSACELAEAMWMGCMAELSCAEAELFFARHPDNIKETTPCGHYFSQFCDDWEPPTEYSFD